MAMSSFSPSRSTALAPKVTRSLNWVLRWPACATLSIESNAALYSVRPHRMLLPVGVYLMMDGMLKLPVEYEYKLSHSTSTVPGSVISVFTCSRLRRVMLDVPRGPAIGRSSNAACPGGANNHSSPQTAQRPRRD